MYLSSSPPIIRIIRSGALLELRKWNFGSKWSYEYRIGHSIDKHCTQQKRQTTNDTQWRRRSNDRRPSTGHTLKHSHSHSRSRSLTALTMNRMSLSDLPLRPSTLQLLKKRGFSTVQELTTAKAGGGGMSNLAAELTVTVQQAAELWREVQRAYQCVTTTTTINNNNNENSSNHAQPSGQTATALLQQHADTNNSSNNSNSSSCTIKAIITFSRDVDQLLDGGVALGELTEIAGVPGAGKTQWVRYACSLLVARCFCNKRMLAILPE